MWYENNYRRVFMDMHLDDSKPEEYLSKLDVDDFVDTMVKASVTNVVVKAKSHVGLHFWPSKLGRIHEGLKRRNLDYVGEMIKKCHANDIAVIVYFSQTHDNYAYDEHPEWRTINVDSTDSREDGGRYGLVCMNNLEYKKYCTEILTELLETYDFEGLFLDMPFWSNLCYCESCRKRFFKETGERIPKTIDWNNPVFLKFAYARQNWVNDFVNEITKCVKSIKPDVSIEQNFAAVGSGWRHGDTEKIMDACDYAGGDYYGGYLEQTFMCKYYNNVTTNKPFSYITSRCDPNLYAHTVSRCHDDLLIHTMNALVHNGAFSMCDAMNPDGTITNEVYATTVKPVYETSKNYERYMSGDMLADVAIWYNTNMKCTENYIQSPLHISEIMKENNIAYNVVGSRNLKKLSEQVLSINDVFDITDCEMADIESYVKAGGNLFITGKLGNERLAQLLKVKVNGESDYTYTYLTPTKKYADLFTTFNPSSPYPIQHRAYEVENLGDAEVLATLTYPYTKRTDNEFSAIHSDPPGIHTTMPSVLMKNVGKGKIIWVIAPLELTKAHHCRQAVKKLIELLLETKQFNSNAPDFVELVSWKKDGKKYISAINQQIKSPVYPIESIVIELPYEAKKVSLLTPSKADLVVECSSGKTTVNLPTLDIFHIIEID